MRLFLPARVSLPLLQDHSIAPPAQHTGKLVFFHISIAICGNNLYPHLCTLLLLCFLGEVQAKRRRKKESDQQKPVIFPGSGRQRHTEFFLLFSGKSVLCVRQDQLCAAFCSWRQGSVCHGNMGGSLWAVQGISWAVCGSGR